MSAVTAEGRAALNGGVNQGPGNFCESAVFEMGPSRSEGDCEVVLAELCSSPSAGFSVYFDKFIFGGRGVRLILGNLWATDFRGNSKIYEINLKLY